ncbi:hypothetical protein LOAG_00608 [Loa loa]|uniref:Uncharacterized protein n=1 Tax=Loa loa TaxID=7209 RepID=A0A1S0UB03_LOALO|nr:hypothetical protein LOAG_00608 [Loa loa]EFO27865.1 hypothetical protein LOAG_00608 [Loa loa]
MACERLLDKKSHLADEQRSTVLPEADRDVIGDEQTWDWSKEQIRKRLSFIVPGNELKWQQCNDDLCDLLLDASKMILKNILEEALKMKRSHLVNSTGICHMFGARKKRVEGNRPTDSYVLLSMKTPLCTADIMDALQADCRFISNAWIRQLLVGRLVGLAFQKTKKKIYFEV